MPTIVNSILFLVRLVSRFVLLFHAVFIDLFLFVWPFCFLALFKVFIINFLLILFCLCCFFTAVC